MIDSKPLQLASLPLHALFFWTDGGCWRVYRQLHRWSDGVVVRCLHPRHPHTVMLPPEQWVAALSSRGMQVDEGVDGWSELWRDWQTATLPVQVVGTSMVPSLPLGSVVRLAPAVGHRWRPGEVVTWADASRKEGPAWNTHRVVRVWHEGGLLRLQTRGDAARALDPPLSETAIMGRVVLAQQGAAQWSPAAPGAFLRAWVGWRIAALKRRM